MWLRVGSATILSALAILFFQSFPNGLQPDLAVLLFVLGAFGIYAEFLLPGAVVPGVTGSVVALLSVSALGRFTWRRDAAVWLFTAAVLIVWQARFVAARRYRICAILACAAAACVVAGELTLLSPSASARVHPAMASATGIPFGLVTSLLYCAAIRARRNKLVRIAKATLS